MITKVPFDDDLFGNPIRGENISYYGIDALQNCPADIAKYLFKDCKVETKNGIIIGFEDNRQVDDYYFIVYIPELGKVTYQLCIDIINTIKT